MGDGTMDFGKRLKYFRKQRRLSQEELASMIKVTRIIISNYERNVSQPKLEHIVSIARALDITTDVLLGTQTLSDDKWLMHQLYTTRDRLKSSKDNGDKSSALHFDFVIEYIEGMKNKKG